MSQASQTCGDSCHFAVSRRSEATRPGRCVASPWECGIVRPNPTQIHRQSFITDNADLVNHGATTSMLQFNTAFLFKATAICAAGCLPISLNRESGFVWTAFLLPVSLAWLVATQVGKHGQFEFTFKQTLDSSVVEFDTINGRYDQWFTRGRIITSGGCLSVAIGFPILHIVDPGPIALWLPIVVLFALGAVLLISYTERRKVLTVKRQFVTDYLLFGRLCWLRRRWQVRDGDYLAVYLSAPNPVKIAIPEFQFCHILFVCRSQRRFMIASMFTSDPVVPDMEIAARRIAKLVDLPYEGYRESHATW